MAARSAGCRAELGRPAAASTASSSARCADPYARWLSLGGGCLQRSRWRPVAISERSRSKPEGDLSLVNLALYAGLGHRYTIGLPAGTPAVLIQPNRTARTGCGSRWLVSPPLLQQGPMKNLAEAGREKIRTSLEALERESGRCPPIPPVGRLFSGGT